MFAAAFSSRRRPARRRGFRPVFEALETRLAPARYTWFLSGDGDFGTAANWRDDFSNPGVPGAGDDAVVPQASIVVTSSANRTVNSFRTTNTARLRIAGGVFSMNNDFIDSGIHQLTVESGATLRTVGGTTNLTNGGSIVRAGGVLEVLAGAVLEFDNGGTHQLNAANALQGAGTFRVNGGTLDPRVPLDAPADLELRNGSIVGTANLNVPAGRTMRWTGGIMTGPAMTVVAAAGTLAIDGPDLKQLVGRTVTVSAGGTVTWDGAGDLRLFNTSVLSNSGTWEVRNDRILQNWTGNSRFDNNAGGTLRKSGGLDVTAIDVPLNNNGTTEAASGTLRLNGGGISSGTFSATAGTLLFASGTHTLSGSAAFAGGGTHLITNGIVVVNTGVTIQNLTIAGGTLDGTGVVTVPGTLSWSNGFMAGTGRTESTGALNISGSDLKQISARTLATSGTTTWTGTGHIRMHNGSVITNSATWDLQSDAAVENWSGNPRFDNNASGTVSKTAGLGVSAIDVPFNNDGTLDAASGTVRLNGDSLSTGTYNATTGVLEFGARTHTLNAGVSFPGGGAQRITGGASVVINTDVTIQNLDIAGNNGLGGTGVVTVVGTLNWTNGSMSGTGQTVVTGTLAISSPNLKQLVSRTLTIATDSATWTDQANLRLHNQAVIDNLGTFTIQTNQTIENWTSNSSFNNVGTLVKAAGTLTAAIDLAFNNLGGTVDVQAGTLLLAGGTSTGGLYRVAADALLDFTDGGTQNITGAWVGEGEGTVRFGSGTINVLAEEASFSFPGTMFQWTGGNLNGATLTNYDTINISGVNLKQMVASRLANAGMVVWTGLGGIRLHNGSVIINDGTWDVQTDADIENWTSNSTFTNNGLVAKTAGTEDTVIGLAFDNYGAVGVYTGRIRLSGGGSLSGYVEIGDGLELTLAGGTHYLENGLAVAGAGRFVIENATAAVNGAVSAVNLGLETGTFLLRPTGMLTLSGNYSQANAIFRVEINGTALGAGYGQLNAAGVVDLNGTLQIVFVDGFNPDSGNSFQVIQAGSRSGTFGNMTVFNLDGRLRAQVDYQATGVVVNIVPATGPEDGPNPGGRTGGEKKGLPLAERTSVSDSTQGYAGRSDVDSIPLLFGHRHGHGSAALEEAMLLAVGQRWGLDVNFDSGI